VGVAKPHVAVTGVLASLGVEVFRRRAEGEANYAPLGLVGEGEAGKEEEEEGEEEAEEEEEEEEVVEEVGGGDDDGNDSDLYDRLEGHDDDDQHIPLIRAATSELAAARGAVTSTFTGVSTSGYGRYKAKFKDNGNTVQVDPIKPKLKPLGSMCLKLKCDVLLSTSAFKFNLRRHTTARTHTWVRSTARRTPPARGTA